MKMNRRDFLKFSGAMALWGMSSSPETMGAAAFSTQQLAILFDSSKCVGCRACQMACKRWNNLPPESSAAEKLPVEIKISQKLYDAPLGLSADTWTLIKLKRTGANDWHFMNYQCMHCMDAACVVVCPTGALYKDERGFTGYDREKCIGCGYCTQFCPYGVPHLTQADVLTGKAKIAKCTFCQDRVYSGIGGPYCATVCPVGALIWGSWDNLVTQAKQRITTLHSQGLETARFYGENEAGGLRRLTILLGEPAQYKLPTTFPSLAVSKIWQNLIQWVGGTAIAGITVGAFVAFLVSRSNIRMEEVE